MTGADALRRRFGGRTPGLMGARHSYAVLCPLVEKEDGLHFLFEVRAAGIRQAGETCFPGGRMEADESPTQCALRETREELSIPADAVTVLGQTDFICSQRGFLLYPVLGLVSAEGLRSLVPSTDEVADTFTVPLDFFRATPPQVYTYDLLPHMREDFPYEAVGIPTDYPWASGQVHVPVWRYGDRVIWGMTARMVQHIIAEITE